MRPALVRRLLAASGFFAYLRFVAAFPSPSARVLVHRQWKTIPLHIFPIFARTRAKVTPERSLRRFSCENCHFRRVSTSTGLTTRFLLAWPLFPLESPDGRLRALSPPSLKFPPFARSLQLREGLLRNPYTLLFCVGALPLTSRSLYGLILFDERSPLPRSLDRTVRPLLGRRVAPGRPLRRLATVPVPVLLY